MYWSHNQEDPPCCPWYAIGPAVAGPQVWEFVVPAQGMIIVESIDATVQGISATANVFSMSLNGAIVWEDVQSLGGSENNYAAWRGALPILGGNTVVVQVQCASGVASGFAVAGTYFLQTQGVQLTSL